MSNAKGFPSIASGESSLTGFISQVDGTPAYTGVFQGMGYALALYLSLESDNRPAMDTPRKKDEGYPISAFKRHKNHHFIY